MVSSFGNTVTRSGAADRGVILQTCPRGSVTVLGLQFYVYHTVELSLVQVREVKKEHGQNKTAAASAKVGQARGLFGLFALDGIRQCPALRGGGMP